MIFVPFHTSYYTTFRYWEVPKIFGVLSRTLALEGLFLARPGENGWTTAMIRALAYQYTKWVHKLLLCPVELGGKSEWCETEVTMRPRLLPG